jgi:hypothetical protein
MAELGVFLDRSLAEVSGKSDLAKAIRYLDGGTLRSPTAPPNVPSGRSSFEQHGS